MTEQVFMGGEAPEFNEEEAAKVQAEFKQAVAEAQAELNGGCGAEAGEAAPAPKRVIEVKVSEAAQAAAAEAVELSADDWQLRATTAEFLALSLRYPTPELIDIVANQDWVGAAKEIAELYGATLPEGWGEDLGEVELHAFRAEATHLMVGAPTPAVSPYEGVWRAADDGVQALLFVNPHSMEVERFCKKCGLGQPEGTNEPLDHVATELELLQYLASVAAGIVAPFEGGPAPEDFPAGGVAQAYAAFMTDHVMVWMPRFAEKLAAEARTPYYKAVGQLLAAILAA